MQHARLGHRGYYSAAAGALGRPAWLDGTFCFGTDRNPHKSRNLRHNPAVLVHLERGGEVVIIGGIASGCPAGLAPIDQAYTPPIRCEAVRSPGRCGDLP
jgi:hypothetical protein